MAAQKAAKAQTKTTRLTALLHRSFVPGNDIHPTLMSAFTIFYCALRQNKLTSTILMISVPGNGCYEVEAGKSCQEAMEAVSLAPF